LAETVLVLPAEARRIYGSLKFLRCSLALPSGTNRRGCKVYEIPSFSGQVT
jgi:hypothetical protein